MGFVNGAKLKFNESLVPQELRHLIPIAERRGFSSPSDQDAFIKIIQIENSSDLNKFNSICNRSESKVGAWLRSLPEQKALELTKENSLHPK